MLQAALNESRSADEHARLPTTATELAADAAACVAVGVGEIHLHPRDDSGQESLAGPVVDRIVRQSV